jgi:small subunit ribosomal protein S6
METVRYETLMLAVPEITKDEASALEKTIDKLIKDTKGSLISFERWGKYRLCYPVRKNEYGVYFLTRYETDKANADSLVKAISDLFKLKYHEIVMREMTSRLLGTDLTYVKPDSLEDIPTRDVDSFLRENKMEGLISTGSSDEKSAKGSRDEYDDEDEDA